MTDVTVELSMSLQFAKNVIRSEILQIYAPPSNPYYSIIYGEIADEIVFVCELSIVGDLLVILKRSDYILFGYFATPVIKGNLCLL